MFHGALVEKLSATGLDNSFIRKGTVFETRYVALHIRPQRSAWPETPTLRLRTFLDPFRNALFLLDELLQMICDSEALDTNEKDIYISFLQSSAKDNLIRTMIIALTSDAYKNRRNLQAFIGLALGIPYDFLIANYNRSIDELKSMMMEKQKELPIREFQY